MVLSAEEKRIRKSERNKKWREKNKEKVLQYEKEYRKENKDKIAEYQKEYNQTPQGIKSRVISGWKKSGLVHEDYDVLYETYLQTNECNVCKKEFKDSFDRCMDHDHSTGLFRQVLCRNCNTQDNWKKKI